MVTPQAGLTCPDCGAPDTGDNSCTNQFYRFITLEFSDPEYGAVHHLTVAAYMLQHPSRLSRNGWLAMRDLLSQFLEEGVSPQGQRAKMKRDADSGRRPWSITKGPRLQLPAGFTWKQTIQSVDDANPTQYRLDIERWARQALADAGAIKIENDWMK